MILIVYREQFTWTGLNFVVFCKVYGQYHQDPEYYYLSKILGNGLCISRATAPILNVTMAVIALPTSRTFNLVMHRIFGRCSLRLLVYYLEKVKVIHLFLGTSLIVVALIHGIAHTVNIVSFIQNYDEQLREINWARDANDNLLRLLLATPTGFSGCVMLATLGGIAYFARRPMRDRFYNGFITSHHLFLVFYGMMFYHPLSNIIKHQTNVDRHRNMCDTVDNKTLHANEDLMVLCGDPPEFSSGDKIAWIWPLVGLLVYIVDVIYRYIYAHSKYGSVKTVQSYTLPGRGVHLQLGYQRQEMVKVTPGQYVLLQCPDISTLEWHPFTVTEIPTETQNTLALTVAVRGDWTQELYEKIINREKVKYRCGGVENFRQLEFLVDGPYPSPMSGMMRCKRILFVGAGIGITPFVSVMRQLLNSNMDYPKRVHLVWIARNLETFSWFAEDIARLQEKFWNQNKPDRLAVKLYWTRNFNRNLMKEFFDDLPAITSRIARGRPKWDEIFQNLATLYPKKSLTVFSCGPKKLTNDLRAKCKEYRKRGCKLSYFHEGFG